jgi:hypothetical protein
MLPAPPEPVREPLRIRFGVGDQSFDVVRRQTGIHREHGRADGDQADRREILLHLERQAGEERGNGDGRIRHQQGMAVRIRLGDDLCAEIACGAGPIVDDEGAAQVVGELLRDGARRDIGRAAGRKSDHNTDRARRVFLREGATRPENDQDQRRQQRASTAVHDCCFLFCRGEERRSLMNCRAHANIRLTAAVAFATVSAPCPERSWSTIDERGDAR